MRAGQTHLNHPEIKSFDRIYRMFRMVREESVSKGRKHHEFERTCGTYIESSSG
jgi:hypothetical protein